jgi:hypothetical protein
LDIETQQEFMVIAIASEEAKERRARDQTYRDRGQEAWPPNGTRARKHGDRGKPQRGNSRNLDPGPLEEQRVVNEGDLKNWNHLAVEKRTEAPAIHKEIESKNENYSGTQAEPKDRLLSRAC